MIVVVFICAALLGAAAVMAIVRIERGPSMLDRAVALDVFTTTLVAAIAIEAAASRRTDTVPILVIVSMVGFVSSVTIARFAAKDPPPGEGPAGQGTPGGGRDMPSATDATDHEGRSR